MCGDSQVWNRGNMVTWAVDMVGVVRIRCFGTWNVLALSTYRNDRKAAVINVATCSPPGAMNDGIGGVSDLLHV